MKMRKKCFFFYWFLTLSEFKNFLSPFFIYIRSGGFGLAPPPGGKSFNMPGPKGSSPNNNN